MSDRKTKFADSPGIHLPDFISFSPRLQVTGVMRTWRGCPKPWRSWGCSAPLSTGCLEVKQLMFRGFFSVPSLRKMRHFGPRSKPQTSETGASE